MSLQSGLDALKEKRYQEAVELLEQFCRNCAQHDQPSIELRGVRSSWETITKNSSLIRLASWAC